MTPVPYRENDRQSIVQHLAYMFCSGGAFEAHRTPHGRFKLWAAGEWDTGYGWVKDEALGRPYLFASLERGLSRANAWEAANAKKWSLHMAPIQYDGEMRVIRYRFELERR